VTVDSPGFLATPNTLTRGVETNRRNAHMKSLASRLLASAVLALIAWLMLAGATASKVAIKQPDKLVILSTTDVKGKTSPCG
jgi:hypothetical protein